MPHTDHNGYSNILPPGTYRARAKKTACGHTESSGTPYVSVTFEILSGEYAGGEIDWKGWLSERAIPYTIKTLITLGFTDTTVDPLADNAPELVAAEAEIVLEHETWKDQPREKVKWINKAGGGKGAQGKLGLDLRAAFASARKEAGVNGKPVNGKPVSPRQPEPAVVAEEDVPF